MIFSKQKNPEKYQKKLDVQEVFSLWDFLKTKYDTGETINIFLNFAHDMDFKTLLGQRRKISEKEYNETEKLLKKFKIAAPQPRRKEVRSSVNTELLTDEYMASIILLFEQELVEMAVNNAISALTNDEIRSFYIRNVSGEISWLDRYVKYFKLKGWLEAPALYPNIPAHHNEQLDCAEVYHLWENLVFRYTNIEITEIYYQITRDSDLQQILKRGIQSILRKDAAILEKELSQFGINLPYQPTSIYDHLARTVAIPDETIFRQVFYGMQSATSKHVRALKKCTTNDRVRSIFNDLLLSEINTINTIIKYGKLKGFLEQTPRLMHQTG